MGRYYICVTPFFPSPEHWQGAYILDQVKAIKRNSGFEVIVFKTNALNRKEEDYDIDGIHVHTIRPLLMPSYILNGLTEKLVGRLFVKKLKRLHIDTDKIAYVHCHTSNHSAFGFGVKRVNPATKVLIQFHDPDPYCIRNGKWSDKRWNIRYRAKKSLSAFNKADLLICVSKVVCDNLLSFPNARKEEMFQSYLDRLNSVKDFSHLQQKNIYVLNNGVDTRIFNKGVVSEHHQKTDNLNRDCSSATLFRIGCIANFADWKDHITLIKAFEILHKKGYEDIILSFIGNGETKSQCVEYLESKGLSPYVEWQKECYHEQLPDYYRSLDLFVLPSYFEGFGCVYTEAAACGVPFMGVFDQGAAECIVPEERDQWLIKPHDYVRLAEIIEKQYLNRNFQHLCRPITIDELIKEYLNFLSYSYTNV